MALVSGADGEGDSVHLHITHTCLMLHNVKHRRNLLISPALQYQIDTRDDVSFQYT